MKECDFCNKYARYVATLGNTKDWMLCKDHLEVYEYGLTDLRLWVNTEAVANA